MGGSPFPKSSEAEFDSLNLFVDTLKMTHSHFIYLGSVWIGLILLKLKTYCWNHCSKIIFKCVNSTVRPIFNEKVAKKWNLWVYKQYMMHCLLQKVNICDYYSLNSNRILAKRVEKKKKKNKNAKHIRVQNADVYPN